MHTIQPSILIGAGYRAKRTIENYMDRIADRRLAETCILPMIVSFSGQSPDATDAQDAIHHITLSSPVFDSPGEWPGDWPVELDELPPSQCERARAWLHAALVQESDNLQEFLLERIPRLSALTTVARLNALGFALAGDSEINVYVVADLNDDLGSSVFVGMASLVNHACRQLGLVPQTTAVLYLPSATSPAPAEEAIAYAALKELESQMRSGHVAGDEASGNGYPVVSAPALHAANAPEPFNGGCYLLDMVNELGYTLQDESQQVTAASEWLYTMTVLGIAPLLRAKLDHRYLTARLRGQVRYYASFGLVTRYVPQKLLIEWAAARLGRDMIEQILNAPPSTDIERQADAFIARLGLFADVLEERFKHQNMPDIREVLSALRHSGFQRIELRTRQALQAMREKLLPALQRGLDQNLSTACAEIRDTTRSATSIILEDTPMGGIAAVHRFLDTLSAKIAGQQEHVKEQRKRQKANLGQSLDVVSTAYYALRSTTMSIPPWPITFLGLAAVLALPFLYILQMVWQRVFPLNFLYGVAALAVLIVGALAVLGFSALRLLRQVQVIRKQHINMVRERFAIESAPLLSRAMDSIYQATQEAIAQAKNDIHGLEAEIQAVAARLQACQAQNVQSLEKLAQPGPACSAVSRAQADTFYRQAVIDRAVSRQQRIVSALQALTAEFERAQGPLSRWQNRCIEDRAGLGDWLEQELLAFGRRALETHLKEVSLVTVLSRKAPDENQDTTKILGAQPLWNYDPMLIQRAKTQQLRLAVGDLDQAMQARLSEADPATVLVPLEGSGSLTVIQVHYGLPLFALRRISEYRTHYAAMLHHGKLPIHTSNAFLLADDPLTWHAGKLLAPATLFAAALALNVIKHDAAGRYLAPQGSQALAQLGPRKNRAVALLGMNSAACRELQRQLGLIVEHKGKAAIHAVLDEYAAVVPHLEDWEIKGIIAFERAYGLELEEQAAQT